MKFTTNLHFFLTNWFICMLLLYKYLHNYIDYLYLSIIIFVIGLYISYCDPKYFVLQIGNKKYIFDGIMKLPLDITHLLLLCIVICLNSTYNIYNTSNTSQYLQMICYEKYLKLQKLINSIIILFTYVLIFNLNVYYIEKPIYVYFLSFIITIFYLLYLIHK